MSTDFANRADSTDRLEPNDSSLSKGFAESAKSAIQVEELSRRLEACRARLIPGLINAHDHLHLNNVPRLPHDAPFASSYAWIEAFAEHHAHPDVVAAVAVPKGARHWQGALKNLLAGVTTVAHHDPWHDALDDPAFPVDVPRDVGWCHSLGLGERARYGPRVRESFDATPVGRPWVIHLAEGTDAEARGELARLETLGCLTERTVLVHGVGLSDADVSRVIARGASLVWCPASNLELLGRTLDAATVRRLFDAGRLALGSDSRLTGARDLLDELHVAASCSDLTDDELLRLVTVDAARILRLDDREGDGVIVRDGALLSRIRRADVRAVVRRGVPVVADLDFADWFARCGVDTVRVRVDGRPKLAARQIVCAEAVSLEPGLEIES